MKAKRYYSLDQYNLGQRTVILALLLGIILGAFLGFLRNQSRSRSLQGQEQLASEVVVARQALSRVNARLSMLKDAFIDSHDNKEDAYALLEAMERRLEGGGGGEIAGLIGSDSRVSKAAGVVNSQPISTVGVSEMLSRVVGDSSLANLPVVNDDSPLSKKLKEVAINNEILVAVSNKNLAAPGFMLDMWIKSCQASGVKNYMVICLDDETERFVRSQNAPAYNMKDVIPTNHGTHNHAVSALKFRILERCLKLGYSVLMSDVDILVFEDPFKHLVRDSDIESMSDGFNEQTAYGYNDVFDDPSMGWSRYAHTMRIFVFNSGLFYVKATQGGLRAMVATAEWLETKGGWDQAVFNEVSPRRSHFGHLLATSR